jgi:hypothetical protein
MGVFVYRGPLPPHSRLFRGRADELARLVRLCHGEVEAYAIVYGGRQTGKTSLLLRLESRLPDHIRTCRVDFQGLPGASTPQVFTYLARRVAGDLSHPTTAPDGEAVQDAPSLIAFLRQAFARPEVGQLVLLLEELGALPRTSRQDLAHVLRSIFTNRFDSSGRSLTKLMVVLAGGIELYELAASHVSPLQNVCEPVHLPDLSEEETVGLIGDGLGDLGLAHSEAQALGQAVYVHVGGHPYLTQRLGGALEEDVAVGSGLMPDHVESATRRLLSDDPLLHHLRRALDEHQLLAASRDLLDGHLRFSRLDDEMAKLELLGLASEADGYWRVRNRLLAQALRDWLAVSSNPDADSSFSVASYAEMVDRLEVRLRDLIDHRLTVVIDRHYWKRAIPGDVIQYVKKRIDEHLARHPYKDPADFVSGRRRLDFCGASHYEKIVMKNWPQFEPFFGRKDELQRHMAAYRALRNCVQHNREPTEVERKSGEAAILWLEGIIQKHEQEKEQP